jgi:hypothetical protein
MSLRCQVPYLDSCIRTVLSADLALSIQSFHKPIGIAIYYGISWSIYPFGVAPPPT